MSSPHKQAVRRPRTWAPHRVLMAAAGLLLLAMAAIEAMPGPPAEDPRQAVIAVEGLH